MITTYAVAKEHCPARRGRQAAASLPPLALLLRSLVGCRLSRSLANCSRWSAVQARAPWTQALSRETRCYPVHRSCAVDDFQASGWVLVAL